MMKKTSQLILFAVAIMAFLGSCRPDERKEKLFIKALQSKWNVDEVDFYDKPSGLTGTMTFTTKKADFDSPYAIADEFYEGNYEYSDGTKGDFYYEYFQILSNNRMEVVMYNTDGTNRTNYVTEVMTNDMWVFYLGSEDDQYLHTVTYYLSK